MAETIYQIKFSNCKLTNTKCAIKTYTNENLNVFGKLKDIMNYYNCFLENAKFSVKTITD